MNRMKISKEFSWEMAHRLREHSGGCQNVHGHSYRMTVEICGEPDPATGMVLDFAELGEMLKPLIEELDHAFLCEARDASLIEFLKKEKMKHKIVPFRTTVENLCGHVARALKPGLEACSRLSEFSVTIHETARNSGTVTVKLK